MNDIRELIERSRQHPGECDCTIGSEAADELERLEAENSRLLAESRRYREALEWEAGETCETDQWKTCENEWPESPDMWCRYCRMMNALDSAPASDSQSREACGQLTREAQEMGLYDPDNTGQKPE